MLYQKRCQLQSSHFQCNNTDAWFLKELPKKKSRGQGSSHFVTRNTDSKKRQGKYSKNIENQSPINNKKISTRRQFVFLFLCIFYTLANNRCTTKAINIIIDT